MGHWAKVPLIVDQKGVVKEVITASVDFIQSGAVGDPSIWFKTSYNTRGGVHYLPDSDVPAPDQSKALRANYAGPDYTLDLSIAPDGVFYAPRPKNKFGPFNSWTLNAPDWIWHPPIPYPTDGKEYIWDDPNMMWVEVPSV